ncbi:MAG TPA: ABC transporter permease, partial [Burkholderiales bacterium]|nr:ABC transporter permease [Burkholderiales bacterium]
SFWTSFLVRTYAWMVILGTRGPISALLRMLGWDPPPEMLFTRFSSTLAMVHILLPFMVLALYAVMRKVELSHLRAAEGLGAPPWAVFRHVFLPLSAPGVINGCTIVFILCLGFYVTPVLLGSPREQMLAGLIGRQIEELLDFGQASAMAIVLLVCTLGFFTLYDRLVGLDKLWG